MTMNIFQSKVKACKNDSYRVVDSNYNEWSKLMVMT